MSFIGNMMNSSQGAGFQGTGADIMKPAGVADANKAQDRVRHAINFQEEAARQLEAAGGIQKQQDVYGQQQQLANMLMQQAQGGGPNPALAQLAQTTQANTANQAALMASQRGGNAGMIARQAAMQGSANQQQAAGQAAVLSAQQQLAAQQALAQQQAQMGNLATNQVQQQIGSQGNYAGSTLGAQQNVLNSIAASNNASVGMQSNLNTTNAGIAQTNVGAQMGLLKGVGSAMTGMYDGGAVCASDGTMVPGHAPVQGDSPKNDVVPAMLSPGEFVIPRSIMQSENPGEMAKRFVELELEKQRLSGGGFVEDSNRIGEAKKKDAEAAARAKQQQGQSNNYRRPGEIKTYEQALKELTYGKGYADGGSVLDTLSNYGSNLLGEVKQGVGEVLESPLKYALTGETDAASKRRILAEVTKQKAEQAAMPAPSNVQLPQAQQSSMPSMSNSNLSSMNNRYQQGVNMEAKAMGEQGRAESQMADQYSNAINELNADTQARLQTNMQQRQQLMKDYNDGKVDPKRLWNSKSDFGKISTAIGLILGGIGSGANGENPALAFLQKQIDSDIDAQKAELGKKQNLISTLQQEYGDITTAANMARVIKMDQYKLMLEKAAAQTKDPIAKGRALQLAAKFDADTAAITQSVVQKQAVMSAAKNGKLTPEQQIGFLPKEQQDAARKALEKYNEVQAVAKSVDDSLESQYALQSTGNRLLSPISSSKQLDAHRLAPMTVGKEVFGAMATEERSMFKDAAEIGYLDSAGDKDTRKKVLKSMISPQGEAARKTLESFGIHIPNQVSTTPIQGMKPRGR